MYLSFQNVTGTCVMLVLRSILGTQNKLTINLCVPSGLCNWSTKFYNRNLGRYRNQIEGQPLCMCIKQARYTQQNVRAEVTPLHLHHFSVAFPCTKLVQVLSNWSDAFG